MSKKPVITTFLPAGMHYGNPKVKKPPPNSYTENPRENQRGNKPLRESNHIQERPRERPSPRENEQPNHNFIPPLNNTQANGDATIGSAPKTLHENTTLGIESFNIKVNEYTFLNAEVVMPSHASSRPEPSTSGSSKRNRNVIDNGDSRNNSNGNCTTINIGLTNGVSTRPVVSELKQQTCCSQNNCDGFVNCSKWCDNNVNFDDSLPEQNKPPFLKLAHTLNEPVNISKQHSFNMFIHGEILPCPVNSLDKVIYNDAIQEALKQMHCTAPINFQMYTWPAVHRGLNVFVVSPKQSGKTLAYLPVICTLALQKFSIYQQLLQYDGPFVVILCSSLEEAETMYNLTSSLIEGYEDDLAVEFLSSSSAKMKNGDIVITVPPVLEDCLKSEKLKLQRLRHFIVEDASAIIKNNHKFMSNLFKILDKIQINRPHKTIQIILTSEEWTTDLKVLLVNLNSSPVVCFGSYVEAAKYSNIYFKKKKIHSNNVKQFGLSDILKKKYTTIRCVVFCDQNEIAPITELLEPNGIECLSLLSDLYENEDMWCALRAGRYKVLICTDEVFEKTERVVNAQWIIHYSFPADLDTFQKRYRCLAENLNSPLTGGDPNGVMCSWQFEVASQKCNEIFSDFCNRISLSQLKYLKL